jgi:hypothetical protein
MVAWPRRQLAVAHGAKLAAQRLRADRHRELVLDPLNEIDQPPAHNAVRRRDGAALDSRRQRCPLAGVEPRATPGRFAVDQSIGSVAVEPQHPVPNRLQADAADKRRRAPAATTVNRRQRQKPADLSGIAAPMSQPPHCRRRKITPQPNRRRHRNLPQNRSVESHQQPIGNRPRESESAIVGIS